MRAAATTRPGCAESVGLSQCNRTPSGSSAGARENGAWTWSIESPISTALGSRAAPLVVMSRASATTGSSAGPTRKRSVRAVALTGPSQMSMGSGVRVGVSRGVL